MQDMTLCFLTRGDPPKEVLLGLKRVGFGAGKYTGFGGKVEEGETVAVAAARELEEEVGVKVSGQDLRHVAHLTFLFPAQPGWSQAVHVFLVARWEGHPEESTEISPAWFSVDEIPFDRMWHDARYWLPPVLAGQRIRATFTLKSDNETVDAMQMHARGAATQADNETVPPNGRGEPSLTGPGQAC